VAGARREVCGIDGLAWLERPHLLDVHFAPGQLHQKPLRGAQIGQHFSWRVGNKEHHRALRRRFHVARVDSRQWQQHVACCSGPAAHCRAGDVAAEKLPLLPLPIYFCDLQTPQPPLANRSWATRFAWRDNAPEYLRENLAWLFVAKMCAVSGDNMISKLLRSVFFRVQKNLRF
jgi:hypothetical protein